MINPFDYLYYKLHSFYNSFGVGDPNSQATLFTMAMLILSNIFTVYLLFFGDLFDTFMNISAIVVGLFTLSYLFPKREKKIITKYEKESETSSEIGYAVVAIYVIVSIIGFILALRYNNT